MENDRDTSLQSWEFLTLFLPRSSVVVVVPYIVLPSVTSKILQTFDCDVLDDAGGKKAFLFAAVASLGRKRVIQRRFNVGVLEAISERKASTL